MWFVFWFLCFVVAACLVLMLPAVWAGVLYSQYRGSRAVSCPETHQQVAVGFKAVRAAVTGVFGKTDLRLAKCTLWPMGVHCGQECIPEAASTAAYTRGEVARPKAKKIYHLPALIAAFAGFVFGVVWHSQYLFRLTWRQTYGLSWADLHPIVWWWSPHLLSLAACLLCAYGVAWLLAVFGRKGIGPGIVSAIFLWSAVAAASLRFVGWNGIPDNVLKIEVSYTFLASIAIGAIVGGLNGKLIAPTSE